VVPQCTFPNWIERIRKRDAIACSQFVEFFTPVLRRVIKTKLIQRRVGSLIDPLDICQIVFGSFFSRVEGCWPQVESMDQLTALMITMARNRLRDELRRHTVTRRDHRRRVGHDGTQPQLHQLEAKDQTPCQVLNYRELRDRVLCQLTEEEWSLLEDRIGGRAWASIACERGNAEVVLRKKLNRAILRIGSGLAVNHSSSAAKVVIALFCN